MSGCEFGCDMLSGMGIFFGQTAAEAAHNAWVAWLMTTIHMAQVACGVLILPSLLYSRWLFGARLVYSFVIFASFVLALFELFIRAGIVKL
jgi:hypothetical protein